MRCQALCSGHVQSRPGWVKRLLAPWVDREFNGIRAKSGELRWFKRINGEICWVPEGTPDAKSITFIPAKVTDNRVLMEANPEYIANLMALPEVEQRRLLHGDWDVRHEGLVYPMFERCVVDAPLRLEVPPTHGGIDWGWANPFAAVWGHFDGDNVLWLTGGRYRSQSTLKEHSEAIPDHVEWWCDPADPESRIELSRAGHSIRACTHFPTRGAGGEKRSPKMSGIAAVSERMTSGRLKIVRCPGTAALIRELGAYRYDPTKESEEPIDKENHMPDAARYLIVGHDRGQLVPPKRTAAQEAAEELAIEAEWEREQEEARQERRRPSWAASKHEGEESNDPYDMSLWEDQ